MKVSVRPSQPLNDDSSAVVHLCLVYFPEPLDGGSSAVVNQWFIFSTHLAYLCCLGTDS